MLLLDVLKNTQIIEKKIFNNFDLSIKGIHFNSKKILKNFIFVAVKGRSDDGHKYIEEALKNGAVLIVIDKKEVIDNLKKNKINFIYTKDSRIFLSKISSNFFSRQPKFISAVTGTNGKTSVSYITRELWKNCNVNSASIGTLGLISNNFKKKLSLTTENSLTIHKLLYDLRKKKINNICIEASSHGLKQNRIDNIKLDIAAFTNISHDHYDYHKDFNDYFKSKMILFSKILKKNGIAIINSDLPEFNKVFNLCKKNKLKIFTYGIKSNDLKIISFYEKNNNQIVEILYKKKNYNFNIPLIGDFQVYNCLCAILIVHLSGVPFNKCIKKIENISQIPGRLEMINIPNNAKKKRISIFVDYAHTPDALEKTLIILKKKSSKLSVVFGCGGNRDNKKRALMGKIADRLSDKIYITDDNPRNEPAAKIRKQIISCCSRAYEIKDRYKAIKKAIDNSEKGEKILVAGKGHEDYQIIGKKIYKFSDKKTILDILKKL